MTLLQDPGVIEDLSILPNLDEELACQWRHKPASDQHYAETICSVEVVAHAETARCHTGRPLLVCETAVNLINDPLTRMTLCMGCVEKMLLVPLPVVRNCWSVRPI